MLYKNENLKEISFPLGGIGTGSIGIAGNGGFVDWEIFGKPNKKSYNGFTHIMVRATQSEKSTYRVLQGDHISDLTGIPGCGFGMGVSNKSMAGFKHFKNCEFNGEYPIADIKFEDSDFPGEIILKAFNPLIPLDSKNSSIPAAFYEITYKNTTDESIDFEVLFSVRNPFAKTVNEIVKKDGCGAVMMKHFGKTYDEPEYGELCLMCENPTEIQPYWFRGRANDAVTVFLNELDSGEKLIIRDYPGGGNEDTCTVTKKISVNAGESKNIRFVLSWNIPNCCNSWIKAGDQDAPADNALLGSKWKHYYATVYKTAYDSAFYAVNNWDYLYEKTLEYKNALFDSTLDSAVIDAAASTVSVIKSSTVYRLENGEFYGFEGTEEHAGSCPGTCQHVYNYAYALCFLFPDLERSIRTLEFDYATYESGATTFRLPLPPAPAEKISACLDGQMGCIIKTYREWKISGDTEWLKQRFEKIKKILEYAWSCENPWEWDRNCDGVLEGKQHNTLDLDLFGPSAWLEGIYLAALKAAAEMAEFLGDFEKQREYLNIYENGKKWTAENLFNGKYFIQKINLTDKSLIDRFNTMADNYFNDYWSDELGEIRYQIGEGCAIDQLCGQWHANICGLGRIFDKTQTDIALETMYKNNFKPKLRDFTNTWRVYGLNDEGGAVICAFPNGARKPKIPIMYCEECMNGFEYQLSGLLISEGMVEQGLEIVKAVRNRYNGFNRNPYSEIECGSNYARSMASFALLPILSGFEFDLPNKKIGFNPMVNKNNFKCIFSLGTGWGTFEKSNSSVKIQLNSGTLNLNKIHLPFADTVKGIVIDGIKTEFHFENKILNTAEFTAEKTIEILL